MICGSQDPETGRICQKPDGHWGIHSDPLRRSKWENHRDGWKITNREWHVLMYTARGFSTDETAAEMGLSPWTIKTHKGRIIKKFGAKNITHAVVIAIRTGQLTVDPM